MGALALLSPPLPANGASSEPLPGTFHHQWCAYRTPHFALLTDLGHRRALATIGGLNRFRRMFLALFPDASGNAGLPLTMLVFRRERDFMELSGSARYAGVTLPSMHEYRLLAARGQPGAPTDNARHEYAHYLLRTRSDRNYPLWYEEGLATYLGAAELARNPVHLGNLPNRRMRLAIHDRAISFQAAIESTSVLGFNRTELLAFYDKAWLLTHFTLHGHDAGFPDWRPALERYLSGTERDFEAAFGHSPTETANLLDRYLVTGQLPRQTLELPRSETPAPERECLADDERDYELAVSITPLNRPVAVRVLTRIAHPFAGADAEPQAGKTGVRYLTALSRAVWADRVRAQALVNRALELAPADPEANVQFAHLLVRGCAFSSASACIGKWARAVERYLAVLKQHPQRYDAAYGLGVAYLHTGRAPEAMGYLRLAYEKMPWKASINFYLGEGYRIARDPRAAAHLRNALHWTSEAMWRERAQFALQRLQDEG